MTGETVLIIFFALAAGLYAAVGHGGASAYLVVMALAGFAPEEMRVNALLLNSVVSLIAAMLFFRHFAWRLFWPFALTSVPFAWLGGWIVVPDGIFYALVGLVLVVAAVRLVLPEGHAPTQALPIVTAWGAGALIGALSGMVGVGGGIFLTPLLVLSGWARPKEAAAVSAVFIFVNSIAGLAGLWAGANTLLPHDSFPAWAAAAVCGGWLGAQWGSRRARPVWLRPTLAVVLLVAAVKFAGRAF